MTKSPMTALNKQALREEFQCMQDHYSDPADRDRQIIYIAAEALLDELEAAEKCIAEHNFENRLLANADRDIKALRERIAELEARAISIPEVRITVAEAKRKNLTWRELGAYNEGADVAKEEILAAIRSAGIGVKGE
ncbi:ead/Ea22-like family protein [Escherichia coli]